MTRKYTNELIALCEDGLLSWELVVICCLKYMSESEVEDMARVNLLIDTDDMEDD